MLINRKDQLLFDKNIFDMQQVSEAIEPAENQSIFDLKNYLQEDLMVKVDRASMHHSLETRAPLLDYRLIQLAFSLPMALRKKEQDSKYLLKQLLYKHVPRELFERPKWGFSIPLGDWLNGDLNYLIQEYLKDEIIRTYNIVNPDIVKSLILRFEAGEHYLYNRLWALILLHKWLVKMEE